MGTCSRLFFHWLACVPTASNPASYVFVYRRRGVKWRFRWGPDDVSCSHERIILLKDKLSCIYAACVSLPVAACCVCTIFSRVSRGLRVPHSAVCWEDTVWSQQGVTGQAAQQRNKAASLIPADRLAATTLLRCFGYCISSRHKIASQTRRISVFLDSFLWCFRLVSSQRSNCVMTFTALCSSLARYLTRR